MSWLRVQTMRGTQVYPTDDIIWPHILDEGCACEPMTGTDEDNMLAIMHNSFDGRELEEQERGH